jgi:hypothetical protein
MNENEKERPIQHNGTGGDAGAPDGAKLKAARQQGEAFFAAADKAIDSVLSGDSLKFNQAARQRGGQ